MEPSPSLAQPPDGASAECEEAWDRAESAAEELAASADDLARCASAGDFADDCGAEFQRVGYSHVDYETASSEVSLECE
jgi:hypothetical protein